MRHCVWLVHAVEQNRPLPLARKSVQTAPVGQVSPAQANVHRPPGIAVEQLDPTEQLASLAQASPIVRADTALQKPVSQMRLTPHCASLVHLGEVSLLQAATRPHIVASAARVRNCTVPPRQPCIRSYKTRCRRGS